MSRLGRTGWCRGLAVVLAVGLALPAVGRDPPPADHGRKTEIPIHLDHIFNGGVNRRGDLVGMHHLPSAPKEMRVEGRMCTVEIVPTSPGGPNEVVTARVVLRDASSNKVVLEKFSTLFPSAWSKAEVEAAIRAAYHDAKAHGGVDREGKFHGHAQGIRIDGYLTRDGDAIATAFPVYQAPRTYPERNRGRP